MTEITIDLETLGTRPGCAILSIGAVAWTEDMPPELWDEFYTTIDLEDCQRRGLRIEAGTLAWWMGQDLGVRAEAFDGVQDLGSVLDEFRSWLDYVSTRGGMRIYGKGPSFDLAILAEGYRACGLAVPWNFWDERCVRTVMEEGERLLGVEAARGLVVRPSMRHHALEDARAEGMTMVAIREAVAAGMTAVGNL